MGGDAGGQTTKDRVSEPRPGAQQKVDALLVEGIEDDVLRRRATRRIAVLSPRVDRPAERALGRGKSLRQRRGVARDGGIGSGRLVGGRSPPRVSIVAAATAEDEH
jgi:hypothetical protein